jgi:uncharacterized membrane protein YhaH (DUF805 family)
MNWLHLLTSLEGRISRQPFWLAFLALTAVEFAAYALGGERASAVASLIAAYPAFAVFAKRGHDRNVPPWVAGLLVAGSAALDLLTLADLAGPMQSPSVPFLAIGIPVGLLGLVLIIDFGFRRGTAGPNRYGPDPLEIQR